MFSFNHEQGACPACKGLGTVTVTDPERLITDPAKSLLAGAMDGTKTGGFYGDPHGRFVAALKAAGRGRGHGLRQALSRPDRGRDGPSLCTGRATAFTTSSGPTGAATGPGISGSAGPGRGFADLVAEEYERKHADHRGQAMRVLMKDDPCPACGGARLKPASLRVKYRGLNIAELSALTVDRSLAFFAAATASPRTRRTAAVTAAVRGEIIRRLGLIRDVGLGYLGLDRASGTLSGGEAQRLRLAGLLGVRLTGVTFVLDEPTLGLHARDTAKLVGLMRGLVAEGNTVVAVEHDLDLIRAADHVLDLGPGAGRGRRPDRGRGAARARSSGRLASVTGPYLAGRAPGRGRWPDRRARRSRSSGPGPTTCGRSTSLSRPGS